MCERETVDLTKATATRLLHFRGRKERNLTCQLKSEHLPAALTGPLSLGRPLRSLCEPSLSAPLVPLCELSESAALRERWDRAERSAVTERGVTALIFNTLSYT